MKKLNSAKAVFFNKPLLNQTLDFLGESLSKFFLTCFVARIIVPLSHGNVAV